MAIDSSRVPLGLFEAEVYEVVFGSVEIRGGGYRPRPVVEAAHGGSLEHRTGLLPHGSRPNDAIGLDAGQPHPMV